MVRKDLKKTQGGFTLIEIIAVLVILGILAAVAVPRFIGLQQEAQRKAMEGLVAAGQSQLSMEYARLILVTGNENTAWGQLTTAPNPAAVCAQVSMDGFPAGTVLACAATANIINLVAADGPVGAGGQVAAGRIFASGTFTRPTPPPVTP